MFQCDGLDSKETRSSTMFVVIGLVMHMRCECGGRGCVCVRAHKEMVQL